MEQVVLVIHLMLALGIIALVLLQQGKGSQAGAAFGNGASQTVFGSRGSSNFLSRTTGVLAGLFFAINVFLAQFTNRIGAQDDLLHSLAPSQEGVSQTQEPSSERTTVEIPE